MGVISPNAVFNVPDENASYDDPDGPWAFDGLAKRASLLFDKLYSTDNLDLTREIVGHYDNTDPKSQTLCYLEDRGLISHHPRATMSGCNTPLVRIDGRMSDTSGAGLRALQDGQQGTRFSAPSEPAY